MPGVHQTLGMEPPLGDTQPLTQKVQDDDEKDEDTLEDLADVIVFLHPASKEALEAVNTTGLIAPQHLRFNANLGPLDELVNRPASAFHTTSEPLALDPLPVNDHVEATQDTQSQDVSKFVRSDNALALRFSSQVNDPTMGFKFGRNSNCDIFIKPNHNKSKISGLHFRIFVTDDGVVMLQDCSTNGTWVDNVILRTKQQHILTQGSTVEVITWTDGQKVYTERASFTVTFPKYEDPMQRARHQLKLETYLLQRARLAHAHLPPSLAAVCIPHYHSQLN